ncbi:sigma-54-dependent Fis family transcriptional regulator [Neobacillus mesonae]|uniref:sigma-54 interaction domain-containing protein n=1 Tax=Neobacillus mesonae TaxID=1193713 RepID=UPI00203C8690|nr:sigma 54-interacting transcriptional regulator [Neobacillus mesonae]MCM3570427.1 sigma 54-interacting transcriptional regulator [Neobacillus mesonae]
MNLIEKDLLQEILHLQESNEQLRTIINFSSDGLYVVDSKGITLEVNRAYENMTGIAREEVIGKDIRDLVFSGYFDRSASYMALQSKQTVTIMQEIKKKKFFVVTATPVFHTEKNHEKKIKMVVTSVRDVTYLNHLQKQLQKAEHANLPLDQEQKLIFPKDPTIVFQSTKMRNLYDKIKQISPYPAPVLITGPSGTGKEVLANLIHQMSERKGKFVKVNCAAIPAELFESELFGYASGSFTGARREGKPGLFEQADNGTILLDEIGEIPLPLQTKLLRVIQDQIVTRVGDVTSKKLSFRLICSTNQDLKQLVHMKKFREDLWYRINVVHLQIPPLCERKDDIGRLIETYTQAFCHQYQIEKRILPETLSILENYSWPGNVRELKNVIEFLVISTPLPEISPYDLPEHINNSWALELPEEDHPDENTKLIHETPSTGNLSLKESMKQFETKLIVTALQNSKSIRLAAAQLGLDHANLIRKMKRLGITYHSRR